MRRYQCPTLRCLCDAVLGALGLVTDHIITNVFWRTYVGVSSGEQFAAQQSVCVCGHIAGMTLGSYVFNATLFRAGAMPSLAMQSTWETGDGSLGGGYSVAPELPSAIKAVFKPHPGPSCSMDDDACSDYKAAVSAVPASSCMAGAICWLVNVACVQQQRSSWIATVLQIDQHRRSACN